MRLAFKFRNKFSKSKYRVSIGLDIGSSTIKLVKLIFLKETVELCGFNLEPISTDAGQLLKTIVQSQGDIKRLNLSVSGPSTIIRYTTFPKMNSDELKQALKFETEKLIPFPLNEVNLDSYILKEYLPDNKMLVLLAAVRKEFIEQRLKLIEEAGFKANIIDIDSIALINAFNFNYPPESGELKNKVIAILNIGATISNLNILEGGIPRLSRDINIAGNNFTQRLQDVLGLDLQSAQDLKLRTNDKEIIDKIAIVVEPVLNNLAHEIRTSFDYYESQSASCVMKIFLSGGGSKLLGLKDMLAKLVGIAVEHWDPLSKINIPHNFDLEKIKEISGQLAVAVGLGLRQ